MTKRRRLNDLHFTSLIRSLAAVAVVGAAIFAGAGCTVEVTCPPGTALTWSTCPPPFRADGGVDGGGTSALSPEILVTEPVMWPAGGKAGLARTATGTMVSLVDRRRGVIRIIRADGSLTEPVSLGQTSEAVSVASTAKGVVAMFSRLNPSDVFSQLLDAETGQPIGPLRLLRSEGQVPQRSFIGRSQGSLYWPRSVFEPDAGRLRTELSQLDDDGAPFGEPLNVSEYGVLTGISEQWSAYETNLADGGSRVTLVAVTPSPGGLTAARVVRLDNRRLFTLGSTASAAMPVFSSITGFTREVAFVDAQGVVIGEVPLGPADDGPLVTGSVGDDGLLVIGEREGFGEPSRLMLLRLSPDGGLSRTELLASDGGEVEPAGLIADSSPPRLVFTRVFSELGRGSWRGTFQLPVTPNLSGPAGPVTPVLTRASTQTYPSFSSRVDVKPLALAWSDDRQQLDEPLIEAIRLTPQGKLLGATYAFERVRTDFTNPNPNGRFIANADDGFVVFTYNGFEANPHSWPSDGGTATKRGDVTPNFGVFGAPFLSAIDGGFWAGWSGVPLWQTRRLDSLGNAVTNVQVPLPEGTGDDVWGDLQLLITKNSIEVARITDTGFSSRSVVANNDGGVWRARFMFSGEVGLVAWQRRTSDPSVALIGTTRIDRDGGLLDESPRQFEVPSGRFDRSLTDIGVRNGVFYVLGFGATDAGNQAWVYRRPDDGGTFDTAPVPLPLGDVGSLAAGPAVPDAGLLLAYTRVQPTVTPVERLYIRMLGDGELVVDAGSFMGDVDVVEPTGCGCTASGGEVWVLALVLGARMGTRERRRLGCPLRSNESVN